MNLYLLRHGIALGIDEAGVRSDDERPLSDKGIRRMRKAARGLGRMKLQCGAILTSPLRRSRQTAEIVAEALGRTGELHVVDELAPGHTPADLCSALERYSKADSLVLVGHQPLLGELLRHLLNRGAAPLEIDLRKGAVCCVKLQRPGDAGVLQWLLTSKQLRLLGRRRLS